MAKENKSTTILLLVIAGALLFLVGSFTGNAFNWGSNVNIKQTTGLTTVQKQDVLDMFRAYCSVKTFAPGDNCINLCNNLGLSNGGGNCVSAYEGKKFIVNGQTIFQVTPVGCDYKNNWNGYIACTCCRSS